MRNGSSAVPGLVAAAATWLLALAAPRMAQAEWPVNGRVITIASRGQVHSAITTDGAGGAIITWEDQQTPNVNIFAHHVRATGELDAAWPVNGRVLLAAPEALASAAGGQNTATIVTDGAGGAIVAWQDERDALTDTDLFAQHVLASGLVDPDWKANGVELCEFPGLQNSIVLVSDGAGGAIAAWMDTRFGANERDIFAQHLLASGEADPRWPVNGLALCTATGRQELPAILADGAGGAIVAWQDARSTLTRTDIFAQHVLVSGVVDRAWPVNGRAICSAPGDQGGPTLISDGAQGAIVAWTDGRVVGTSHVFAQHVSGTGVVDPLWPVNGTAVSAAATIEGGALAVPDGAGGAVVSWQAVTGHVNMYAQHVAATGFVDPAWPAGGRALSIVDRNQTHPQIVSDGAGGALVAWDDSTEIVTQHVFLSGRLDPAFADTGRVVCRLPETRGDAAMVATGDGGAIVSWTDARNRTSTSPDLFAIQVLAVPGALDVPPPAGERLSLARPTPNPSRDAFTLRFSLPSPMRARITIHDATGRRIRSLDAGTLPSGEHALIWDRRDERGAEARAGLYFVRFEAGGRVLQRKLITLR